MKGYKTLAFGMALAALGFAQQFDWAAIVPAHWTGLVMAGIGGMVMWLRSITNTPMGKPE